MYLTGITIFNIDVIYLLIGLTLLFLVSLLLNIISLSKIGGLRRRYEDFLSGKDGKSLEEEIYQRFDRLDELEEKNTKLGKQIDLNRVRLSTTYSKMKILKYNAFDNLGGETSFVLGLLNEHNNGILLNSMNNGSEGYFYAKEIQNGKPKTALSEEEEKTLAQCMNQ
ncbi:MAG: DUF4446 family protein [Anaerostipes sp.]|jgi:hypothetical protein|nr:DUF4446 family protein [Anaerostipes sp.]MDD3746505.1 DUF4446 family protein [Anaerostipes sp.]